MAINRKTTTTNDELNLIINNGDLKVLKETTNRLGFLNEESMLRYLLAVMSKSAIQSLIITDQTGTKIPLNPSESLLMPDTQKQTQ